jgi:hypothetical protein
MIGEADGRSNAGTCPLTVASRVTVAGRVSAFNLSSDHPVEHRIDQITVKKLRDVKKFVFDRDLSVPQSLIELTNIERISIVIDWQDHSNDSSIITMITVSSQLYQNKWSDDGKRGETATTKIRFSDMTDHLS